jgi:hypothetical protein
MSRLHRRRLFWPVVNSYRRLMAAKFCAISLRIVNIGLRAEAEWFNTGLHRMAPAMHMRFVEKNCVRWYDLTYHVEVDYVPTNSEPNLHAANSFRHIHGACLRAVDG